MMKQTYDCSQLAWTVEGYTPFVWLFERLYGGMAGNAKCLDIPPVPAPVPGSAQEALRLAGILPDWKIGTNYRQCEWVEHRHWMYRVQIPDDWLPRPASQPDAKIRLECLGLDYSGWIYVNGQEVGTFKGTHIPHTFDLTQHVKESTNVLEIIFDQPPRWLGQFGYTSQMTEWKPRFNYTWDWSPRLVQIGIWDNISLVIVQGGEIRKLSCSTDADIQHNSGILDIQGEVTGDEDQTVLVRLEGPTGLISSAEISVNEFRQGMRWQDLPVQLWFPNLEGAQPLYTLTCVLLDVQGREQDRQERCLGFKHVEWLPCEGAPPQADPWICVVNGRPVFLQGVNFAPLLANFADLRRQDYEKRLRQYQQLGLNTFRINACQFLEKEWFYDLCDELGLMVWQEFPLTSSGLENWPPEDEASIQALTEIATSFIERRKHHVSLLLWSGGNELQGDIEGNKTGIGKPCDLSHPMLKRLQEVTRALDPIHRYIPTSPSGPRSGASPEDFGKGLHWDVHGGAAMFLDQNKARKYWQEDDALFRSEIYCPGASSLEVIKKYAGDFQLFPPTEDNPYWSRLTTWWIDWHRLIAINEAVPRDLEEYIAWSQGLQAEMLASEMKACKDRFPRCGGVLMWSGHDTFPLAINSSLIDFDGNLKPAALAVSEIWRSKKI